ncbi:class I SAM-dependent rRNA methyltransferase [Pseudomonas aeruginosa]|uniref:class I SAM-dependent rRNA methyltransferase n=1 Tax=Pseudomonas aeruginosa TaxID=287 RepID=UPI001EEE43E3|nr:class I SAM-dependent rRNA methyltransferase [Pseudomonas aeruginosa]MCG7115797.1 class I SAM-dependent rRNA methyltransferase [Pseudomonas aeruginosa]
MTLPSLRLKANAERRLRAGHLWVYSNEVDVAATPLNAFAAGDQAVLEMANGKPLGIVALSPNNLICGRLISRDTKHVLDKSLLVHRINIALSLRERLFDKPFYRLVYGDSDLLPGLVVDRFGDVLVVQLASAAMELRKDEVLAALLQALKPAAVLWKNDSSARDAEGLERYVANAYGEVPEWVALEENGVKFEAPVLAGQKTGWFYDHRMNRARLAPYVRGKRVLDLFSYIGGWGIQAAAFGASEVMCVDASAFALDGVERNAALNGVAEKVTCVEGDVFEALRELKAADERFDVVIADPPAFIKRKKDLKNGEAAYRRLNEQAMRLLSKDGILVSASCSMHLPEDDLQNILIGSARHLDRNIQLLERGGQGPDHPVHLAIAETRYIKSLTCRLLPNG